MFEGRSIVHCKKAVCVATRGDSGAGLHFKNESKLLTTPTLCYTPGNKLLAKIGSALNKPNKQTIVLPRGVAPLMQVCATSD